MVLTYFTCLFMHDMCKAVYCIQVHTPQLGEEILYKSLLVTPIITLRSSAQLFEH